MISLDTIRQVDEVSKIADNVIYAWKMQSAHVIWAQFK